MYQEKRIQTICNIICRPLVAMADVSIFDMAQRITSQTHVFLDECFPVIQERVNKEEGETYPYYLGQFLVHSINNSIR